MTKKTLGYTQLQWTCPNCGTQNPGAEKTCVNCGFAQPDDVEFHQAANETLITDETELGEAKSGADIYCFYCGTRNPADAKTCRQCGGDLTQGTHRHSGEVLGAHSDTPVPQIPCPSCGELVDPDAEICPHCGASIQHPPKKQPEKPIAPAKSAGKGMLVGVALFLLLACVAIYFLFIRTTDTSARVTTVHWTRTVAIEALGPVQHEDWRSNIPTNAVVGTCIQKVEHAQDTSVPNSKEVCGTPYTVDNGNGYGEVTQDCQYEVHADWCQFTVQEWQAINQMVAEGNDFSPYDPASTLSANQREGARNAEYVIQFDADGEKYTFTTADETLFNRAQIGTRWVLKVNSLGAVTDIKPAE